MSRVTFVAGASGPWAIQSVTPVRGEGLGLAPRLDRIEAPDFTLISGSVWHLRGVRSHERYVELEEKRRLSAVQPGLDRPEARRGALIPIKKKAEWWGLAQDERRRLFEDTSHHIAIGLEYLPAVARRLYHSKDLGEPFDFLTWFEFAEKDAGSFEELVFRLRATEEWSYVEREVDVRLTRGG
jgi:chlorite dismutase